MTPEFATKEQLEQIYSHFNTTEEALRADAKNLRQWMKQQPHLPDISDEEFLMNIILRSKLSMEKSKKFVDRYYTARALDDMFSKRSISAQHTLDCIRSTRLAMLPKLTPDNERIYLWGVTEQMPDIPTLTEDIFETTTILLDIALKMDRVKSAILICDMRNMNLQWAAISTMLLKRLLTFTTKVIHHPYRKIYVMINPMFEYFVSFAKRISKKKMADRIEVWTKKPTDFPEVLPKSVLPSDYGGDLPSIDEILESTVQYVPTFHEWIVQERGLRADLSKRPKNYLEEDSDSIFGIEGSFRKLVVD